ncbi:NAD-binding protein, partial [Methylobacterium organophilum]|nr:NAD-binding protein [Methylobacterium organophilum]
MIVGFGRVGSSIGATLETWDLPYVVVERDRRRVLALRAAGTQAMPWRRRASGRRWATSSPRKRICLACAAGRRCSPLSRASSSS